MSAPAPWIDPMNRYRLSPPAINPFHVPADEIGFSFGAPKWPAMSSPSTQLLAAMIDVPTVFFFDTGMSSARLLRQIEFAVDGRVYRRDLSAALAATRISDAWSIDLISRGAARRKQKRVQRRNRCIQQVGSPINGR